jgi:hypothetical protein
VRAADTATSEMAAARRESGKRPSLVASREVGKRRREDRRRGGGGSGNDGADGNVEVDGTGMEEESSLGETRGCIKFCEVVKVFESGVKLDDVVIFWEEVEESKGGALLPEWVGTMGEPVSEMVMVGTVSVIVIGGIVEGAGADKRGEEEGGGGGEGETTGEGEDAGAGLGGMREPASQDGGAEGASSTVVPGRRVEGRASRCSMNVTWNELKTFPVVTSHSR